MIELLVVIAIIAVLIAPTLADAVAQVADLTRSSKWNANQWYDFACVYAVASGKIADKKQAYADRAMELPVRGTHKFGQIVGFR